MVNEIHLNGELMLLLSQTTFEDYDCFSHNTITRTAQKCQNQVLYKEKSKFVYRRTCNLQNIVTKLRPLTFGILKTYIHDRLEPARSTGV